MKLKLFFTALTAAIAAITAAVFPVAAYAQAANVCASIPEKYLDERELEIYRYILKNLAAISEGKQNAEAFYLNVSAPFSSKKEYEDAVEKAMFFVRNYAPEYTFWIDGSGYLVYDTVKCGIVYSISPVYRSVGNEKLMRADRLDEAEKALANARSIADKYNGKSDYEKIIGYADEICALNSYNKLAYYDLDTYSQENIDPWRIVYMFDGDPSTNVVCAGYAQAFQYLCGLGGIECHYVTGMVGELHAWNIVVLDGKSYFVDLTFCDSFPEKEIKKGHPYILDHVVMNAGDGFSTYYDYSGTLAADTETYKYDDDVMKYLPETLLTMSTEAYRKRGFQFRFWHFLVILLAAAGAYWFIKKKRENEFY